MRFHRGCNVNINANNSSNDFHTTADSSLYMNSTNYTNAKIENRDNKKLNPLGMVSVSRIRIFSAR